MASEGQNAARMRDPRLDFFRGLGMFIILLAHTPGNLWTLWIPARFGFSDATEIFVFCSGMASAIAFGRVFETHGLPMGTARIAHRVWQVYWAHIGLFLAVAMAMVALNHFALTDRDYVGQLNLYPFFNNPMDNLIGLLTLTYVPNYFDILPMYLVILAMIPIVMGLSRLSPQAPLVFMGLLWAATNVGSWYEDGGIEALAPLAEQLSFLHLPAQLWFEPPNNTREWFFNPFGWQLVFLTGFAFMRGWIPAPPVNRWLIGIAAAVVLLNVPLSNVGVRVWSLEPVKALELGWASDWRAGVIEWRQDWRFLFTKTDFGILRYVHFLSLAYLAWVAAGERGVRLAWGTLWPRFVAVVRKVGQQSLAVFLVSMFIARFMGLAFDLWGKDWWTVWAVNLGGFGVLIVTAYTVSWFKGQPWRKPPKPREEREARPAFAERAA